MVSATIWKHPADVSGRDRTEVSEPKTKGFTNALSFDKAHHQIEYAWNSQARFHAAKNAHKLCNKNAVKITLVVQVDEHVINQDVQ